MPKIKKKRAGSFTITDNQLVRDPTMSFKARGLFEYLWSQKDGWNYYEREIVKHTTDGITAVRSGLDELEKHGYLKRMRVRNKGKLGGTVWLLSETGDLKKSDKPTLENLKQENLTQENLKLRNTNQKKHQLEETLTKRDTGKSDRRSLTVKQLESEFASLWERYPNKKGKKEAFNHYKAWRREKKDHTFLYISRKLNNYITYIQQNNIKPRYIMHGSTWFNGRFDDDLQVDNVSNNNLPASGGYENANNVGPDIPDSQIPF